MATHSSIFACRILWTEEPGRLQTGGHKESNTTEYNGSPNVGLSQLVPLPSESMGSAFCFRKKQKNIWKKLSKTYVDMFTNVFMENNLMIQ